MNINDKLIEKYHLNTCTPEERREVEEWLFNEDVEDLDSAILELNKEKLKHEMWQEIVAVMPPIAQPFPIKTKMYFMWKGAIAATLLIIGLGGLSYLLFKQNSIHSTQSISFINTSNHLVKHIDEKEFSASVGPNTIAKINGENGVIDLTGSILISPKHDIKILQDAHQPTILKKGQTYIILKNTHGKDGVIVISENNLLDMPPVMQQQITTQFGI